jgi:HAMP domain-containing protein
MFKAYWAQYKFVALALAFLVVAALSWNISSSVSENEFNTERIGLLTATIEAQKFNDTLKSDITKSLLEALAASREEMKKANKEALNEIFTNPSYRTCTITPGVRDAYTNAIRAQSASRGNAGVVQTPPRTPVR